jgi:hypothetical protein
VIAADDNGIARFYCPTGAPGCTMMTDYTAYSSVTALSSLVLGIPQGIIYTPAPDGGGVKGLVTLLFENGPVVTFDPGHLGGSSPHGYIGMDTIDSGTSCDQGTCFYTGTNSACAVTLYDGDHNVIGGRIYDVVNQDWVVNAAPSEKEQYQGRLYALTIATSGIAQNWDYDFVTNGIVGPSAASPMCSPNGNVFTDYGSALQDGDPCVLADVPVGTSCGAGVLGLIDCAIQSCIGSTTYQVVPGYPLAIGGLPTDSALHVTGVPGAGQYFTANFSYDPTNGCFWVRPFAVETMSCLSSTGAPAPLVVAAINVAQVATVGGTVNTNWDTIYPTSNVPIATSPTNANDSLAIIGGASVTAGVYYAVLAVDTGQCSSAPCCTDWVVYSALSCPSVGAWSTSPALSWYFDLTANSGGLADGQFAIVNDVEGSPCLVAFTDNSAGTWLLTNTSAIPEPQGGCAL